ncbi:MAG: response regulator [bacterium]
MPRILLVDNEPECIKSTGILLRSKGYEVLEARGVDDFLIVVNTQLQLIDLIILDLDLPGMNGAEIIEKFGCCLYENKIPVLMYTSVYNKREKYHLLDELSLYGEYAPISFISKSNPDELLREVAFQLSFKGK